MFRRAKQNRIFEDVVDQIQEAVLEGRLKAGSKLPSERELQEIFKASRGTLREALRVLEQKGLITIKTGVKGGAVIRTPTTSQVTESLDLLVRYQRVSLRHLAEFREGVEGIVAGLAVERATKKDVRLLKELLQEAEDHLEAGETHWDALIEVDNRVHMALARISGNPIYESILQTIYDHIHRYFDQFLAREEDIIREIYQDLCEIVQAVENGEAARTQLLVQNHVYKFNRLMEETAGRKGGIQQDPRP